jgi:capsular exopolysaccharide synthesis family protein
MITQSSNNGTRARSAAPGSFTEVVGDHCRDIVDRLFWLGQETSRPLRTLGVTSSRRGEGVSTVAAHLAAAAAARHEGRVLLVDANLAHPAAPRIFGVAPAPGLADCIGSGEPAVELIQPSAMTNLFVLSAGKMVGSPARVYESPKLAGLVQELADRFDLTVFDLPPVHQASCTSRLTSALDGVVLVIEAERVPWEAVARVRQLLVRADGHLVGAVLNKHRDPIARVIAEHSPTL